MLLQTNSYIVPKERRAEHARLLRRFRQILLRLGCDDFEVFEQMGPNWKAADATGRFVQLMRFRDRKHQRQVHAAEQSDPQAQQLINEFCDLINLPYQQQQGLLAIGYYQSVVEVPAASARGRGAAAQAEADEAPEPMMGFGGFGLTGAPADMHAVPLDEQEEAPAEEALDEAPAEEAAEAFAEPAAEAELEPEAEPLAEEEQLAEEQQPLEEQPEAEAPGEEVLAEEIPAEEALAEEPATELTESAHEASAATASTEVSTEPADVFDLDFLAGELEPATAAEEAPAHAEEAELADELTAFERLAPSDATLTESPEVSAESELHAEVPPVVNTAEPAIVEAPVENVAAAAPPEEAAAHDEQPGELEPQDLLLDGLDLEPPAAETIADISAETSTEIGEQPAVEEQPAEQSELEALDLSDLMPPEEATPEVVSTTEAPALDLSEPTETATGTMPEALSTEHAPAELQAHEPEPAALVEDELASLGEMPESVEELPADIAEPPAVSAEVHPRDVEAPADILPAEFQVEEVPAAEEQISVEELETAAPVAEANELVAVDLLEPAPAEAGEITETQPSAETQPPADTHALAEPEPEAAAGQETYSPLDVAHGLSELDLDELHPSHIAPMDAMEHGAPAAEVQPTATQHGTPAMVQPGHHVPEEAAAVETEAISEPAAEEPGALVVSSNGEQTWHGNGLPVHLTAEEGDIEIIYETIPEGAGEASVAHQ